MYQKPIITTANEQKQTGTDRENQQLVAQVMDRHREPAFPQLPDWSQRRLVQGHIRKELEKGFDFRLRKLSMELDTALHRIREESNHCLVTAKAGLRKERMEFFADSYHEVAERFNVLTDRYLAGLDERFKRLEKFTSKTIREREEQRLSKSVDDFLSTLDQLIDEYRAIISEHIDHE